MNTTIECPATGTELIFDLPIDERAMEAHWDSELQIKCPACNGTHEVPFRKAYVASVMSGFMCMPADIREAPVQ